MASSYIIAASGACLMPSKVCKVLWKLESREDFLIKVAFGLGIEM